MPDGDEDFQLRECLLETGLKALQVAEDLRLRLGLKIQDAEHHEPVLENPVLGPLQAAQWELSLNGRDCAKPGQQLVLDMDVCGLFSRSAVVVVSTRPGRKQKKHLPD